MREKPRSAASCTHTHTPHWGCARNQYTCPWPESNPGPFSPQTYGLSTEPHRFQPQHTLTHQHTHSLFLLHASFFSTALIVFKQHSTCACHLFYPLTEGPRKTMFVLSFCWGFLGFFFFFVPYSYSHTKNSVWHGQSTATVSSWVWLCLTFTHLETYVDGLQVPGLGGEPVGNLQL
uniref:Uncharacterized protein n=1 Tax=Pipistrellus kuhlii TaxID=59472 RepID=A0A7J7ZJH5_PIPKU|nr:hypothetical protein mPipKuh1_009646 [Pipistrellus kuhlii]